MEEILSELGTALRERLAIIADDQSRQDEVRHIARLQRISEKIEQLEQRLPTGMDPQLRHYLQRRSYTKALELIAALEGSAD